MATGVAAMDCVTWCHLFGRIVMRPTTKNAGVVVVWRSDQLVPLGWAFVFVAERTGTAIATVAVAVTLATLVNFACLSSLAAVASASGN